MRPARFWPLDRIRRPSAIRLTLPVYLPHARFRYPHLECAHAVRDGVFSSELTVADKGSLTWGGCPSRISTKRPKAPERRAYVISLALGPDQRPLPRTHLSIQTDLRILAQARRTAQPNSDAPIEGVPPGPISYPSQPQLDFPMFQE